MGQKINPVSLRLGVNDLWDSRWVNSIKYAQFFQNDLLIRSFIEDVCFNQEIIMGRCVIWRTNQLHSSTQSVHKALDKPAILIYVQIYVPFKIHNALISWSHKCNWLSMFENNMQMCLDDYYKDKLHIGLLVDPIYEEITQSLKRIKSKQDTDANINSDVVRWILNKDCAFIAQWIAVSFQKRKGMKEICKIIDKCLDYIKEERLDTERIITGIKVTCSGRFKLTDNEKRRNKMARVKTFKKGQISLQTIKKQINYYASTAYTPDGTSGIKVWIAYEDVYKNA